MHAVQLHCFYLEKETFIVYLLTHMRVRMQVRTYSGVSKLAFKMSADTKKRKVDMECCIFNKMWTAKFLFAEVRSQVLSLWCAGGYVQGLESPLHEQNCREVQLF